MQRFLPFLPDGEAAGEGGEALAVIADDLEWLLAADAAELWAVARADPSLALLIASFLQYAKRPYDEGFSQQPATLLTVWQRMLPLLHRLVCGEERGAPSRADRAAVLSRLLDLPRLLDVCALYGATPAAAAAPGATAASTGRSGSSSTAAGQLAHLVGETLKLLPQLRSQLVQAGPIIAQNLGQVAEACMTAAGKAGRDPAMMQSLQDGIAYLRDTCLTLASLVQAHPAAAALLMQQGPGLIEALGTLHDQLLPAVHKLARSAGASGAADGMQQHQLLTLLLRRGCHAELASERLAQLLLLHCYVQPAADAAAAGSSSGAGSSRAGSSRAGSSGGSAVARGEELLHGLMLLGHREEESGAGGARGGAGSGLSLGQALAQRLGLGGSIYAALETGSLSLDDAQADYVAALLGLSSLEQAPGPPLPGGGSGGAAKRAPGAALAGGSGGQAGASDGLDLAQLQSKIQQVKDLLPDFGDGFVAACLHQLGGSTERVLNALLEGSLPAQLASLDRQLSLAQWQAAAPSAAMAGGKGKRAVGAGEEAPSYDSEFPATLPGSSSSARAGVGADAAADASQQPRAGGATAVVESRTARYLDVREETYREALVSAANAAQWEYDDEYDDSFDDLITFGADGVTEVEEAAGRGAGAQRGGGPPAPAPASAQQQLQAGAQAFQPGRPAQAAGPGQGRGPKGKGSRLWVLDGRIYNYAKPGAQEVGSQQEAEAALAAAEQAASQIMGLGAGGNKPWRAQQQQQQQQPPPGAAGAAAAGEAAAGAGGDSKAGAAGSGAAGPSGGAGGGGRGGAGGRGGGRDGGGARGGGRGAGRGDHRFKDQHKASIGNHHRKDRAAAKQGRGMW